MFFPLTEYGQNPQMERHSFISLSSLLASETCLVREISRGCPDCVGGRDVVHHHHIHAPNGVQEIVTVQHPNARIIREERSIVALMRLDSNGVQVDRATCERLAIAFHDVEGAPMRMDGNAAELCPFAPLHCTRGKAHPYGLPLCHR